MKSKSPSAPAKSPSAPNKAKPTPNKAKKTTTPLWQRKEGQSPSGGLNAKGIASYRKEHPNSKLKMAVTTKPSQIKPNSTDAKRRNSFCARMTGMKNKRTSPEVAKDTNSRINKALKKWNC